MATPCIFCSIVAKETPAHLHVVPMYSDQDVTSAAYARVVDGEVMFLAEHVPLADSVEQAEMARRLVKRLG